MAAPYTPTGLTLANYNHSSWIVGGSFTSGMPLGDYFYVMGSTYITQYSYNWTLTSPMGTVSHTLSIPDNFGYYSYITNNNQNIYSVFANNSSYVRHYYMSVASCSMEEVIRTVYRPYTPNSFSGGTYIDWGTTLDPSFTGSYVDGFGGTYTWANWGVTMNITNTVEDFLFLDSGTLDASFGSYDNFFAEKPSISFSVPQDNFDWFFNYFRLNGTWANTTYDVVMYSTGNVDTSLSNLEYNKYYYLPSESVNDITFVFPVDFFNDNYIQFNIGRIYRQMVPLSLK